MNFMDLRVGVSQEVRLGWVKHETGRSSASKDCGVWTGVQTAIDPQLLFIETNHKPPSCSLQFKREAGAESSRLMVIWEIRLTPV